MGEYSALIARVRSPYALTESDAQEIADALEAQARRIAHLENHGELNEKLIRSLRDQVTESDARIAELEAALKISRDIFAYIGHDDGLEECIAALGEKG